MIIHLNGKSKSIPDHSSLEEEVRNCCPKPEVVICELNGKIINRDIWADTLLKNGDTLELVTFVGGG